MTSTIGLRNVDARTMRLVLPDSTDQDMPSGMPVVFLAGSIDEGRAEKWQDEAVAALSDIAVTVLNPRRDAWDAGLRQDEDEPRFVQQVDWEMDGIERADVVLFHFSPAGPAPITLLELGLSIGLGKTIVVSCPEGYWRRGNVQVACRRARVVVHAGLADAIADLKRLLDSRAGPKRETEGRGPKNHSRNGDAVLQKRHNHEKESDNGLR